MKLLQLVLYGSILLLSFSGFAQSEIFSVDKTGIGGQNIQYVKSKNSFVYANNGYLQFYSITQKGLLKDSIQLSTDVKQKIAGIAVNDTYNYVVAGDKDSIYVVDINEMKVTKTLPLQYEGYYGTTFNILDFSTSGEEFIYYDGKHILIKNVEDWQTLHSIRYTRTMYSLDIQSLEKVFVAGDEHYGYDMYNLVDNECDSSLVSPDPNDDYYSINQGKILKNGDVMILGFQGFDGLRVWEDKKSKYFLGYAGHAGDYNGFALTPNESLIAYAEYDIYSYEENHAVILKVVDMNTKKSKREIRIPMETQYDFDVTGLALSPDGKYLATSEFYKVKIYKLY